MPELRTITVYTKIFTPSVIYILVNLNDVDHPDYFILTPSEVIQKIQQYANRGILQLGKVKGDEFLGRWDRIV